MKYEIKETQLKKIVSEEYDKLVKEGYIPSTAFNGFSTKGGETGILVANEKLSDFITYVEKTPGVFENLPPVLIDVYQDAKNYFDAYPHLDKNQKPMGEGIVDKFTPYTPEEREQNFIPFTSKDTRTPFEKNPSYERALKAAQERKRQKELEKQNGAKTESKRQIHVTKDDITEAINQILKEYKTNKGRF